MVQSHKRRCTYVGWNFVVIPCLAGFLLPSFTHAALFVLINKLGAELLTNLKSFVVIVSNHVGDDVFRFDLCIEHHFSDHQFHRASFAQGNNESEEITDDDTRQTCGGEKQ